MKTKFDLRIVTVGYNVKDLLLACLESIYKNKKKDDKWEVFLVDNASTDGTEEAVRKQFPQVEIVKNKTNVGFSQGNNSGLKNLDSDYVLFLNPDTLVEGDVIQKSLEYLVTHPDLAALTCRVDLPNGQLDKSCHRGFPTPWNSFCYFTGISRLFPKSKLLAGYMASYLDLSKTHEVDCITGAFFMVRKSAGEQVGWWDEHYFWNGEDIEFCFRLREKNWKIAYYPEGRIIHFKGSSSGLQATKKTVVSKETKLRSAKAAMQAMRIFYNKHYLNKQDPLTRAITKLGITLLEKLRFAKINLGLKYE